MHLIFRTLFTFLRSRRGVRRGRTIGHYDVGHLRVRTLPTDLDVIGHMNNGVYLSIFDLGRYDLLVRSGLWAEFSKRGWYPVVSSETITFRRSLRLWQPFVIESRVIGYDHKAIFIEHRVVVDGEIYTQAFVRGRLKKKSGGTVSNAELHEVIGAPPAGLEVPEFLLRWGADVALPNTHTPAPSVWSKR